MTKKAVIIILFIGFLIPVAHSQRWKLRRYEATIGLGTTHFYGDIGGTADDKNLGGLKDIQLQYTRPAISLGFRYKLTGDMALKLNLNYGYVTGDDLDSRNDGRNFAFVSTIFEPSVQFEYYLLPEGRSFSSAALFNRRGMINNYSKIYIYLFGGVGGTFFYPKPQKDFETSDRFTDNFSKFGLVFPVGIGLKYTIDSNWSLGLEVGRRFTLTDYIDGYTSDFSEHNDTYYLGVFNLIYKVRTDRRGRPLFRSRGFIR